MASNLAKRLDRLERLIRERTQPDTSPLYFREGDSIPEEIAPERVIFIKRVLIDPPEREEEELQRCKRSPRSRILRQRILIVRCAIQTWWSSD